MYLQIQEPSLWIKSKLTNIILSHRGGIGNRKEKPMDTKVKIISMDEIQAEEIKWLWKPYIPFGKLTIVQGDPGEGKTTFVLRLAAQLSQGKGFDDSMEISEPMNVIYQTAEDGLADTIKPRLLSANADCSKIKVIDDTEKSLYMDDERLEIAIREQNAKLLILDPLQAYLGDRVDMNRANEAREMTKKLSAMAERTGCAVILVGHMNKGSGAKAAYRGDRVDMNRANEAREMTKKLSAMAERTGCAVILVGHMNKGSGAKAAYRGIGSIDFFAIARSVLLVGRVPNDSSIRAIVQIKNNLEKEGETMAFRLSDSGFQWLGESDISADELLSGCSSTDKHKTAVEFLQNVLSDGKEVPASSIFAQARALGVSKRTMENIKQELGVKSIKSGNLWMWKMP